MPIDYPSGVTAKSEADYQAEDDAMTLARAEAIKADEKRLAAAKDKARQMLDGEKKDVQLLAKVAGKPAGVRRVQGASIKTLTGHNVFKRI